MISVGKLFEALPVAFFWLVFVWSIGIILTDSAFYQNQLLFWFFISALPIIFLLMLTATILLLRCIINSKSSLD